MQKENRENYLRNFSTNGGREPLPYFALTKATYFCIPNRK
jgi:hypothetical protein